MAPLWKAMLSKSSPLYRDSLFSFSLWEWKAQERELALLKKHTDRERRALLTQLDKLSKELQQKDKVIESLRAKLNQHQSHHHHQHHRSCTPCSSHALSETTDQSDRISYVSDEQGSTNEDLELCSDMEAASEFGQEETRASTRASTGFAVPQSKPLQDFPLSTLQQASSSGFLPLSYHGAMPSPLGGATSASLNASPATKPGAGLLESRALWDMPYGTRPMRVGAADLSSGSSGYQSGTSHTGSDLMKEHLREIRSLRQRLEDSIQTNDRLRQQLEEKLANTAREKGAPTNIYIQGLDSVGQLSGEIRLLKEENISLQSQLRQAAKDGSKEADELREAVLLERAKLKEAQLEAERWAEQSRRLQAEAQGHSQEITQLKQDRQRNQETINRLQHEVSVLQQQLCESCSLVHSLQCELQAYNRVCGVPKNTHSGQASESSQPGDSAVAFNPRELHAQLEQRLTGQADTHARRQLFNDSVPSPPVRDTGLFSPSSPLSPTQEPAEEAEAADQAPNLQGQAPDGSFANRHGRHAVGHVDDFKALQQQILEGSALVCKIEATLHTLSSPALPEFSLHQPMDTGVVMQLLDNSQTLRQILGEATSLLRMFWRAALPSSEESNHSTKQEQSLREEISSLRLRLTEQEEALRDAMERLRSSNRTKDSMEHFIVSQLSRTRDVLKKAKTNLQVKTQDDSVSSPSLLVGVS